MYVNFTNGNEIKLSERIYKYLGIVKELGMKSLYLMRLEIGKIYGHKNEAQAELTTQ